MKKISLIALLLISSNLFCQNISLKAIYLKSLKKPIISKSEENNQKNEILKNIEKQSNNILEEIKFELLVKGSESSFYVKDYMVLKSKHFYKAAIGLGINLKGEFYYNINENETLNRKESFGEYFIVKSDFNKKWVLHNETKKIGKFLCYKATSFDEKKNPFLNEVKKNLITCWYTLEIPVKGSIGNYTNLPGLIIMLENENASIRLNKIVLNPEEGFEIKKPNNGKRVTLEEFKDIVEQVTNEYRKG
ncbi:MAG: GLPGLI family protein [Lutibacter sp.]|uniref:GLPGLI family protein n=1 Tax=Lutibacter sp. TaxID=1925666 RepID=UPI001A02FE75|nr:GLPGLI family protein [Lutibacter sp.]NOR27180.1 GLPGLI family protein [Lutibacter sp.]